MYYDFECDTCSERFTKQQSVAEHEKARSPKCPKCGSEKSHPVFSPVHVQTSRKS